MTEPDVISVTERDGIILVKVGCERMEDKYARAMQTQVDQASGQTPSLPVVLDMSMVTILPSISIGALVTLWEEFKRTGRRFILVGLQDEIRETLRICRLDKLFEICESVDDALSRLRPPAE